jgi:hypothetical protein
MEGVGRIGSPLFSPPGNAGKPSSFHPSYGYLFSVLILSKKKGVWMERKKGVSRSVHPSPNPYTTCTIVGEVFAFGTSGDGYSHRLAARKKRVPIPRHNRDDVIRKPAKWVVTLDCATHWAPQKAAKVLVTLVTILGSV